MICRVRTHELTIEKIARERDCRCVCAFRLGETRQISWLLGFLQLLVQLRQTSIKSSISASLTFRLESSYCALLSTSSSSSSWLNYYFNLIIAITLDSFSSRALIYIRAYNMYVTHWSQNSIYKIFSIITYVQRTMCVA